MKLRKIIYNIVSLYQLIIKIIQNGYLIKDRLLRPASVVIAKKGENKKK